MPKITQEQYEIMIGKGLTSQEISNIAQQKGYTISFDNPQAEGIIRGIKEDIGGRITETLKAGERFQEGKQTLPETILQTGGQIAGGFTDIIMKGIGAIIPDIIEEPIKTGLGKVAQTETAQKAIQGYQSWAEKNPRAAADLEAVVNIASLYPAAKSAQGIIKGGAKTTQYGFKAVSGTGKITAAGGKQVFKSAFDLTAKEALLVQAYKAKVPFSQRFMAALKGKEIAQAPITAGETAFRKGLVGTETMIGVQAKRATTNLWDDMINPALSQTKEKVNMKSFFKDIEKKIVNETKDAARRRDLLDALGSLKDDYKHIPNVSYSRLQGIKSDWAKFVPEKAYKGKPIAGAYNEVKNMAAEEARHKIYSALGEEVKQAYLDYGNLKGLMQWGRKAMTEGAFKGGFGSFMSAFYDTTMTPIKTIGGKIIYKTGKGLELIGEKGAKTIADIFD